MMILLLSFAPSLTDKGASTARFEPILSINRTKNGIIERNTNTKKKSRRENATLILRIALMNTDVCPKLDLSLNSLLITIFLARPHPLVDSTLKSSVLQPQYVVPGFRN